MADKVFTPIAPLQRYYKSNPRAELSESEAALYTEVLNHFTAPGYVLAVVEKGELTDNEKFWLSRETILRYLRATKWKTAALAIERLENTLRWRREYGIYDKVSAEHVEPEAVTGKEILFGFDVHGKPAFYMIPSRQNTDEPTRQVEFAVWMLERCIDLMQPGVENVAWLINFADRAKNPSLGTAKQVVNILQDHYPERLGLALAINVPFLINAFFRVVLPFVDPVTRAKLRFNPDVVKEGIFEKDQVMADAWGGNHNFVYEHEMYWPALLKATQENADKWMKKWKQLGGNIGTSEWDYKGGDEVEEPEEEEEFKDMSEVDAPAPREPSPARVSSTPPALAALPVVPDIVIQPATATFPPEHKKDNTETTVTSGGNAVHAGAVATNAGTGGGDAGNSGGGDGGDGGAAE